MTKEVTAVESRSVNNSGLALIENETTQQMATQLQAISNFQTMVQKNLTPKQDYGVIPGTGKPTLLKPGAEKIQMLMGVTSEYNVVDKVEDYDKGFFAYTIKCVLKKNDQKITEGLGSANTKEKKYVKQDPYSMINTVLKMAKKRAQVDATLTIASLSNVFTQDIEDMDNIAQQEKIASVDSNNAGDLVVSFGKYRNQTINQIYFDHPDYVEWLASSSNRADVKKAAQIVVQQGGNKRVPSASKPKPATTQQKPKVAVSSSSNRTQAQADLSKSAAYDRSLENQMPPDYGQNVDISDDDLPF
ncbi:hypothetical protein [Lapidilactobacillus bayanensis]|uniref:hypothetical protein n=1 Tax=Lapidilactobacillus bayanensis TaxID=2485998 RepID=UPI000F7B0290|nr:hypothetical protein [Lapidilactobacillus bayanensis]